MQWIKIVLIVIVALAVSAFGLAQTDLMKTDRARTSALTDVVVDFETSQLDAKVWYGTAAGGASGNVRIEMIDPRPAALRGMWAGAARWQIIAGDQSFDAVTVGKINTFNGVTVMRGWVTNGVNEGARVEARGQVLAINPQVFAGTVRIVMP